MTKYNPKQLARMARTVLQARSKNDTRYAEFVMTVAIRTGMTSHHVERKIQEYANANP